jgi:hypothetical protein
MIEFGRFFVILHKFLILSAYEYRKDKGQVVQNLHSGG